MVSRESQPLPVTTAPADVLTSYDRRPDRSPETPPPDSGSSSSGPASRPDHSVARTRSGTIEGWDQSPEWGWTRGDRQFLTTLLCLVAALMLWRCWSDLQRQSRSVTVRPAAPAAPLQPSPTFLASSGQRDHESRRTQHLQGSEPANAPEPRAETGSRFTVSDDGAEQTGTQAPVYRIDVNTANWVEWAQLDGIGETLARRIVADREQSGPFKSVEDVQRVRGIGEKTLRRMRPHLTWNPSPTQP